MNFHKNTKDFVTKSDYIIHETKRSVLFRFLLLVCVIVTYFIFISLHYGGADGLLITLLTWSFFVFCTPIVSAGFLLDFPVRLITKIRMIYSEIVVWIVAFSINVYALTFIPQIYEKIVLLKLFNQILLNPYPLWIIIIISAIGTFMSVRFGDELIDISKHKHRKQYAKHKNKHHFIIVLSLVVITLISYYFILFELGINI